jgi:hypothetical protein
MNEITPDHLVRSVYVYVRQSTLDQLANNPERRRRTKLNRLTSSQFSPAALTTERLNPLNFLRDMSRPKTNSTMK